MTIAQITEERRLLEEQIEQAVSQFRKRCSLQEWQVTVSWGPVTVMALSNGGPSAASYCAMVQVRA